MLTRDARPVALIDRARVSLVGTRGAGRLPRVRRTDRTRDAGAGLLEIALAGGRAAHRAGRADDVGRTGLVRPVAALGGIAEIARAGATPDRGGTHRVRRTAGARSRAR